MDLGHYWQYTDMVTKTLCFILFALSMASWVVGILRIIHSRQLGERVVSELTEHIQRTLAPLTQLSLDSKKTVVEQTLLQQLSRYRFDSEQGLSVLGTTAAIAPFIGLFGTVWGIMSSFIGLAKVQQATLATVAPGIAEALIATAIGLFAAIPAVLAYNHFMANSDVLNNKYSMFADEFLGILHREGSY